MNFSITCVTPDLRGFSQTDEQSNSGLVAFNSCLIPFRAFEESEI
jgi:hypothetical protein